MSDSDARRRRLLQGLPGVAMLAALPSAESHTIAGGRLPFEPGAAEAPVRVVGGPWVFFTADEARAVEAIVDRLIPADDITVGGKEAGCAVFIDRQLAGDYGSAIRLYMRPPFVTGLATQGNQSPLTPRERYRAGLARLDQSCRAAAGGKAFADLPDQDQDRLLQRMESGDLAWEGPVTARQFFDDLLTNTMEGFFGDPVYGGNRNMVSWRALGFPGVRYDFRDHVTKHNQRYPLPPVSIAGRPEWKKG